MLILKYYLKRFMPVNIMGNPEKKILNSNIGDLGAAILNQSVSKLGINANPNQTGI